MKFRYSYCFCHYNNNTRIILFIIFTINLVFSLEISAANLPVGSVLNITELKRLDYEEQSLNKNSKKYEEESESENVNAKERIVCDYPVIDDPKDYGMGTIELLQQAGFDAETHYVTSEDGYISQVHRIPAPGKPVVYVLHGIFQSSRDLLMNCNNRALAHKLFNDGYDVWLGNIRGNSYSKNHTTLSPDSWAYWSWGMDEISIYDEPAAIDYMINVTGQSKINFISYSLSSTIFFGMLAARPEYNKKINLGITIANCVFMGHVRSIPLKILAPVRKLVEMFFYIFWKGEVFSRGLTNIYRLLAPVWCRLTSKSRPDTCPVTLWYLDGHDTKQINHPYLPLMTGGTPESTSARLVGHCLQNIARGTFTKYDFGFFKNLLRYGSFHPPVYDTSKIVAPIINYWAENDFVATKGGALELGAKVPLRGNKRVNWTDFNHFDYLYGKDADILVYDSILKDLKQWNPM